ncbi:MAG TPA: anti-sigma factor antagonist, partial [Epsilonproteobacteria bacterium]|nr:anti-sigma factor antagonist [Campylobacterota bacterium]
MLSSFFLTVYTVLSCDIISFMNMNQPFLHIENLEDHLVIHSRGAWTLYNEPTIHKMLQKISPQKRIVWDFSGVEAFDSSGVLLFMAYYEMFKSQGEVVLTGYSE